MEGIEKAKQKISPKCMKIANLIAAGLIGVGIILRFVYLFTKAFDFLLLVLTLYLVFFDVIIVLAIIQNPKVLYYIRFLARGRGLGLYLIFVAFLVLEIPDTLEIMLAVVIIGVALIDICFNVIDPVEFETKEVNGRSKQYEAKPPGKNQAPPAVQHAQPLGQKPSYGV